MERWGEERGEAHFGEERGERCGEEREDRLGEVLGGEEAREETEETRDFFLLFLMACGELLMLELFSMSLSVAKNKQTKKKKKISPKTT